MAPTSTSDQSSPDGGSANSPAEDPSSATEPRGDFWVTDSRPTSGNGPGSADDHVFAAGPVSEVLGAGGTIYLVGGRAEAEAFARAAARATRPVAATYALSGSWNPASAGFLASAKRIVVVARAGDASLDAARQIARVFEAEKIPVQVKQVPGQDGAGLVEHLKAGGKVKDLVRVLPTSPDAEPDEEPTPDVGTDDAARFRLGRASDFSPTNAEWLVTHGEYGLVPIGELTLLAGREGVGKSTYAYDLVAQITTGKCPGTCKGKRRDVIVVATEDSWEHTILPRLMAAKADCHRVRLIQVSYAEGSERELSLEDVAILQAAIRECDAALVLLDPLMSRLSGKTDTHKDAEVRSELEPVVRVAHATGCAVLGLIHVNKGDSADVLNSVMGSKAFTAVARSVLFVMEDPREPDCKLFGQAKNNLGPKMVGTRAFTIEGTEVVGGAGDGIRTSRPKWVSTTRPARCTTCRRSPVSRPAARRSRSRPPIGS